MTERMYRTHCEVKKQKYYTATLNILIYKDRMNMKMANILSIYSQKIRLQMVLIFFVLIFIFKNFYNECILFL